MAVKTRALPAGWSKILDDVHQRLDHAVAAANARLEGLPPVRTESLAEERRGDFAQWSERLARLSAFLESAEQVVQSVDELLRREEDQLRGQLAACETLRRKAG